MAEIEYFTQAGLQKLRDELDRLILEERPKVVQAIAEARDKGDLSENAEYDAAKEAQQHLEMKIVELQQLIMSARIIDESKIDTSKAEALEGVKKVVVGSSDMKLTGVLLQDRPILAFDRVRYYGEPIAIVIANIFRENRPAPHAKIGQFAEREYFGKPCGLLDQMASSLGGFTYADFNNPNENRLNIENILDFRKRIKEDY